MLKKALYSFAAGAALMGSALAADLPARAPAPVLPPPPVFSWTGLYIGVNGGYIERSGVSSVGTALSNDGTAGALFPYSPLAAASATFTVPRQQGGLAGGTVGFNWEWKPFVIGVEADFDAVFLRRNQTFGGLVPAAGFPGFPFFTAVNVNSRMDYLGTVRGRIGVTPFAPLLVYATGGVAYARDQFTALYLQQITPTGGCPVCNPYSTAITSSNNRVGYVVGAGAEYALWSNWSLKGEVLYYNLGSRTATALLINPNVGSLFTVTGVTVSRKSDGVIARAGVNYRFNLFGPPAAPVVARY
jgi:outer membrane immunogenic protein